MAVENRLFSFNSTSCQVSMPDGRKVSCNDPTLEFGSDPFGLFTDKTAPAVVKNEKLYCDPKDSSTWGPGAVFYYDKNDPPPAPPAPVPSPAKATSGVKASGGGKAAVTQWTAQRQIELAGFKSAAQIKELQKDLGVDQSGKIDAKTSSAWTKRVNEMQDAIANFKDDKGNLKYKGALGTTGPKKNGVDGVYGPKTHAAYQKAKGGAPFKAGGAFGELAPKVSGGGKTPAPAPTPAPTPTPSPATPKTPTPAPKPPIPVKAATPPVKTPPPTKAPAAAAPIAVSPRPPSSGVKASASASVSVSAKAEVKAEAKPAPQPAAKPAPQPAPKPAAQPAATQPVKTEAKAPASTEAKTPVAVSKRPPPRSR